MSDVIPSTALVLVAVLPHPRDLDIARLLGWYRLPLRKAPKVINVDYLAFYQTASFGEAHKWQIEFLAEMRGHELTTRADLLKDEINHPRAKEEYYKIQLGSLFPLKHPIRATGWKRITFLYTTGDRITQAVNISDLVVKSDERDLLWRSLRERALQNNHYKPGEIELDIHPDILKWFLLRRDA